jgi:carbonic anhydrase
MKRVEVVYAYEHDDHASSRQRPGDADAARRRMDDGSQALAALFAGLDGNAGTARREIRVDPRDLGLLLDHVGSPEQHPYAAVLGCADARVPIELIFNEGPNDLFVVRVAGNTLGEDVLGSLSYALEHLGGGLKLVAVLGHSGCGAVTAAVDVFLNPNNYLSFASKHAVRRLVERLQVIVQAAATRMDAAFGPGVRSHPGYREALIEVAVVTNAAVSAYTIQQEIGGIDGVRTAYGVYLLVDCAVWAPRCGSKQVLGLAYPPTTAQGFVDFGDAVLGSERISRLLAS